MAQTDDDLFLDILDVIHHHVTAHRLDGKNHQTMTWEEIENRLETLPNRRYKNSKSTIAMGKIVGARIPGLKTRAANKVRSLHVFDFKGKPDANLWAKFQSCGLER